MKDMFNINNPVWNFMGKLADLMLLNILVIVCSLPIFTIGASWTALYYVTMRMAKKEESYIVKDFFRSFKENFKQATIIWMMVFVAILIFVGDILVYRMMPDMIPDFLMILVFCMMFVVLGTVVYVFPVLARFHNSTINTIRNAFLISLVHVPYTLLFFVLVISPVVLMRAAMFIAPILLLMVVSMPAYIFSILLVRVLRKFEPKEVEETNETEIDSIETNDMEANA